MNAPLSDADAMATAHDAPDALGHEVPGHGAPGGGGAPVDEHGHGHDDHHDDHGHDDHGHDDHHDDHGAHGPADDAWVLLPIVVGIILGVILIVVLGLGTDASPFS